MHSLHKGGAGLLAAGALVLAGLNAPATYADASSAAARTGSNTTTRVTLTPQHLRGWVQRAFDNDTFEELTPQQRFVRGPETPPAGIGSLRFLLRSPEDANRIEQFRTTRYDGTALSRLWKIRYSTYQRATNTDPDPKQPVYMRLSVDTDRDRAPDESLFFFPSNNADQQPVLQRTWQTWNPGTGRFNINGDDGPANAVTLHKYVKTHPRARIVNTGGGARNSGGVAFIVGDPTQAGGRYNLDRIIIGRTGAFLPNIRFDLEPETRVALDLSQARHKRLRVQVGTRPAAAGAPVTIFRVRNGERTRLFTDELNQNGRLTRVLAMRYQPGTVIRAFAKVRTNGLVYKSPLVRFVTH